MALPSVVSPSVSSLSPPTGGSGGLITTPDSHAFFDGMLFANAEFAASSSAHFNTPATIYLETQKNNQAHSGSINSQSVHSEDKADCITSSPPAYGEKSESPQYFDFDMATDRHQMLSQLDQPGTSQQQPLLLPSSPATSPQSSLELSSLQQSLEKNRESLKHKLSHRASIRELVCRGIYPSPRIPIAHAEQRRKLERAKTGDLLRHHIQSRPDREYLVGQNILQADGRIDVHIAARQKELKKCRLAENLNQHLVTRPGPLDLVDRNILEAPQQLHLALRAGLLPISSSKIETGPEVAYTDSQQSPYFSSTIDATVASTMPSPAAFVFDPVIAPGATVVHATPGTTNAAIPMILSNQQLAVYTPLSTITGVVTSAQPSCDYVILQQQSEQQQPSASADMASSFTSVTTNGNARRLEDCSSTLRKGTANFKISKTVAGATQRSKSQTLKFHEYKGPPEILKAAKQQSETHTVSSSTGTRRLQSMSDSAARDHLSALIKQQSLYLKYQKYSSGNGSPSSTAPATANNGLVVNSNQNSGHNTSIPPSLTSSALSLSLSPPSTCSTCSNTSAIPVNTSSMSPASHGSVLTCPEQNNSNVVSDRIVTRQILSDLRVSELRSYCRQLGLPISGTKQTLVERLDSRLNFSRQSSVSSPPQPSVASHSSSALFFGDTNSVTRKGKGFKTESSEEVDDVITISSSASSPGIMHENESGAGQSSHAVIGWNSVNHSNEASEQLLRLHYCVESQQRHIEQLKAELQLERRKRLDENSVSNEDNIVSKSSCTPIWQNADELKKSHQRDFLNSHVSGMPEGTDTSMAELPSHGSVGVTELDDIMDLIGSFPDVSGTQDTPSHVSMQFMSHEVTTNKQPREGSNNVWHMNELGLTHCDNNSSPSPMSPWIFDNDNLHFSGVVTGGGAVSTAYDQNCHSDRFISSNAGGMPDTAFVTHNTNANRFPVVDDFFTQNQALSRANFT